MGILEVVHLKYFAGAQETEESENIWRETDRQSAVMFNLYSTVRAGKRKVGAVRAVSEIHWTSKKEQKFH